MSEPTIRDVFKSEEYVAALRQRIVDGTAKKFEVDLAQTLGIAVTQEDRTCEALRAMDPEARRMLNDLAVVAESVESPSLRVIRSAGWVGVVMPETTDPHRLRWLAAAGNPTDRPAEPASENDLDLMPPKKA
jgi:hypothetical protein